MAHRSLYSSSLLYGMMNEWCGTFGHIPTHHCDFQEYVLHSGSQEILNLIRERFASGARGRDRRHQPIWERWKCPDKLGLGPGLYWDFLGFPHYNLFHSTSEPLVIERKKEDSCYRLPQHPLPPVQGMATACPNPIPYGLQGSSGSKVQQGSPFSLSYQLPSQPVKSKAGPASLPSAPSPVHHLGTREKEMRNYGQN